MSNLQPSLTCENCGRSVGKLEPRYTWQSHGVCAECYARLSTAVLPAAAPSATPSVTPGAGIVPAAHAEPPAVPPESVLFEGHPSVLTALGFFLFCGGVLFIAFPVFIWGLVSNHDWSYFLMVLGLILGLASAIAILVRYLKIRFIHYRLSSQRLFVTTGILAKKTIEIELFRIRDLSVHQTFFQRLLGIGSVHVISSDSDVPKLDFFGIHNPLKIKELLRQHIMEARQRTRTRDLDISDLPGGF